LHRSFFIHQHREAEVRDLYSAIRIDENVRGLDVAMHKSLRMGEFQSITYLPDDIERLGQGQWTSLDQLMEIRAIHMFHHEIERSSAGFPEVMDRHNVRMIQPGKGLGFASETFGRRGIATQLGRKDFQCHLPVQRYLPRLIDGTHAAATEHADFREAGEHILDLGIIRRRPLDRSLRRPRSAGSTQHASQQTCGVEPGECSGRWIGSLHGGRMNHFFLKIATSR